MNARPAGVTKVAKRFGFHGGVVDLATDDEITWRVYWRGGVVPIATGREVAMWRVADAITSYVMAEAMGVLS